MMKPGTKLFKAAIAIAGLSLCPAAFADEISVSTYGVSFSGLPYAIALEHGLFQKAGVDVTGVIGSEGGGTTLRNVFASKLPYGEVALSAALAAKQQGLDLVIVDAGFRTYVDSDLVTLPNSGLTSLSQLVGKKVGITNKRSLSEMLLEMALKAKGIDPESVTRVSAGGYGQAMTMLDQGAVAAASLAIPLTVINKAKYRTLSHYGDILPPLTATVGVTTPAFAKANPDKIKAIIAGRRAAVDMIYNDQAGAEATMQRFLHLSPEVAKESFALLIAAREWGRGDFNSDEFQRAADGLKLVGELHGDVDWKSIVDASYLPADLKDGH